MKVILLEDVKSLGKKGDVVDVSDGYADNFLIKNKKGAPANKANLNNLEHQKAREAKDAAEQLQKAEEFKARIEKETIRVTMKRGEGDKVFGSVSSKEIAQAASDQYGFAIDKKKIVLSEPIKSFGTHEAVLKLHPKVAATLKISVVEQ